MTQQAISTIDAARTFRNTIIRRRSTSERVDATIDGVNELFVTVLDSYVLDSAALTPEARGHAEKARDHLYEAFKALVELKQSV